MLPTSTTTPKKPISFQASIFREQKRYYQQPRSQIVFLEDKRSCFESPQFSDSADMSHKQRRSSDFSADQTCDSLNESGVLQKQCRSKLNYFSSKFTKNNEKRISETDYCQKFKTELCKNFQLKGFCLWADTVF